MGSGRAAATSTCSASRPSSAARSLPTDDRRGGGPDGPVAVIGYRVLAAPLRRRRRPSSAGAAHRRTCAFHHRRRRPAGILRHRRRPHVRRRDTARRRTARPRQRELAGSPEHVVVEHPHPSAAGSGAFNRRCRMHSRRSSRRSARRRFPDTYREQDKNHATCPVPLELQPASTGSVVSPQALSATTHDDHVRGVAGAADCLRQHRESSARARLGAPSRAQHPCGARRLALPSGPPAARMRAFCSRVRARSPASPSRPGAARLLVRASSRRRPTACFSSSTLDWRGSRVHRRRCGRDVDQSSARRRRCAARACSRTTRSSLRDRSIAGDSRFSLGNLLVIAQVALSLMLVVAAGLFVRTFSSLARLDLGCR